MEDVIVSISTALGIGAISIIRLSGKEAISITQKIFRGKDLSKVDSHTISYGHICDGDEVIDEVMVSVMRAPKTYTREDIVEINCHGGIATTRKILELAVQNGARLAEPGEFTKRAFLNGRIDLIEAEGVMDLINSKTEEARSLALNQINGKTSDLIKQLRLKIVNLVANIEVNIDYPEYEDIEQVTIKMIEKDIKDIKVKLKKIIEEGEIGKIIKDGIDTVIIGRPNVGKSSLLNRLIDEEKAIVTEIAGTTRDIVEGQINLDGIILNIIDTAGIRKTSNKIEKIGVKKSLELISKAELILYVLSNNEELNYDDKKILNLIKNKTSIVIVNKIDLKQKLNLDLIDREHLIFMSTINNKGLDDLKQKIKELFNLNEIKSKDFTYITNARILGILKRILIDIEDIEIGIKQKMPIDIIEIDLKRMWNELGEIIGVTYDEELIDHLFSQFCLGK